MNETICWRCKAKIEYDGDKYRDVICPVCEILNSIYPHPEMVKCLWCEAEIPADSEICPDCGSKVTKEGLDKAVESNPGVVC